MTVEILEGARLVRDVPVAAIVDEPVGLGAYMEAGALHRLLREGPTFSGAYLKVDPIFAPGLYLLLKRTPAVTGVAVRETMRASFWKTVGESIVSTTAVLVGFACVIAFGIVYNGARIALSERGNELAALRVLGFTRREIGRILLGEQAILTLLAIPVGFVLGFATVTLGLKDSLAGFTATAFCRECQNIYFRRYCGVHRCRSFGPGCGPAFAADGSDRCIEVEGMRSV